MSGGATVAREVALDFVHRFCAGDVDGLASLLADDLRLRGPYLEIDSKKDYLAALSADPPEPTRYRLLSVTEDEGHVAIFYDYEKPDATTCVAQLLRVRDGLVSEIRVVFDTRRRG